MKIRVAAIFGIMSILGSVCGCSQHSTSKHSSSSMNNAKPGEYYSFKTTEGAFKVLKVLENDGDVIHICWYNNLFDHRPNKDIMPALFFGDYHSGSDTFIARQDGIMTSGKKHRAFTEVSWNAWDVELLATGTVEPEELEAYEKWKNGDRVVFRTETIPVQ